MKKENKRKEEKNVKQNKRGKKQKLKGSSGRNRGESVEDKTAERVHTRMRVCLCLYFVCCVFIVERKKIAKKEDEMK